MAHLIPRLLARQGPGKCLLTQRLPLSTAAVKPATSLVNSQNELFTQNMNFFGLKDLYTMEELMESRVHLGHKDGMLNPHMRPFIFGRRLGVHIIDLEHTVRLLDRAMLVTAEIAYRTGIIMFVYQSRQCGYIVENMAKECGEYAFCRRWINEVFTDSQNTFNSVTRLPDLVILFSVVQRVNQTHEAVQMSAKMLIPTIGICDTNANPTLVTYPVPGNDDTPQSIELYCRLFKKAVLSGKTKRKEIIDKYGEDFYYSTLNDDNQRTLVMSSTSTPS